MVVSRITLPFTTSTDIVQTLSPGSVSRYKTMEDTKVRISHSTPLPLLATDISTIAETGVIEKLMPLWYDILIGEANGRIITTVITKQLFLQTPETLTILVPIASR